MSEQEKELVRAAIARYGDLAYDLSGLVTEVNAFSLLALLGSCIASMEPPLVPCFLFNWSRKGLLFVH